MLVIDSEWYGVFYIIVYIDYGFGDVLNLIRGIDILVIKVFLSCMNWIES